MAFVFVIIILAFFGFASVSAYAFYNRNHQLAEKSAKITGGIAVVGVFALLVTVLAPSSNVNSSANDVDQTSDVNALPSTTVKNIGACPSDFLQVSNSADTDTEVQVSFEILNGSSDSACTLAGAPKVTVHTDNTSVSSLATKQAEPVVLQPGEKTTFKLTFADAQPYTDVTDCSIVTTYDVFLATGAAIATEADASGQFCPSRVAPTAGDLSPPQGSLTN